jgi:tubulin alpha
MREVVTLHLGHAGLGTGRALWDSLRREAETAGEPAPHHAFFEEGGAPRAVWGDLEPWAGPLPGGSLHCGADGGAGNFARARYHIGPGVAPGLEQGLRAALARCSSPQGVLLTHSLAGASGSGLAALVLPRLREVLPRKAARVALALLPTARLSTSVVDAYNATWALHELEEELDLSIHCDNQALYSGALELGATDPSFPELDQQVGDCLAAATLGLRRPGASLSSLASLTAALVPQPSLRHTVAARGPAGGGLGPWRPLLQGEGGAALASCVFPSSGQDEAAGRSSLVPSSQALCCRQARVEASQEGPPAGRITNSTSFAGNLRQIGQQFDRLYSKRAFVHWFVGMGLEDSIFDYAREDLRRLEDRYSDAERELSTITTTTNHHHHHQHGHNHDRPLT